MSKNTEAKLYTVAEGEVTLWCDPAGVVCIKTMEPHGDPVELTEDEALELAAILTKLAEEAR
jgi:hypothetical protein